MSSTDQQSRIAALRDSKARRQAVVDAWKEALSPDDFLVLEKLAKIARRAATVARNLEVLMLANEDSATAQDATEGSI